MTTKPVPSTDPADLAINAGLFDTFMHGTAATFTDRLGAPKWTMAGAAALYPDATTRAAEALASADAAAAAQAAAEAARDAAIIQPGLYATEALGRAAVADGEAFKVQGSGDVAAFEYRRTDASTSVLLASYAASSIGARTTYLEQARDFMPGGQSVFQNVKRLRLYGANQAKFYSVNTFFRDDSGTRFNFTVTQSDTAAGAGAVDVASFASSGVTYSGQQAFTLAQVSGSGVTGVLVVDFTSAPSTWGVYRGSGGATFTNLAIRSDVVDSSTAEDARSDARAAAVVATGISLIRGRWLPFADSLSNEFLAKFIRNVWVYGADKSHTYIFSQVEAQLYRRTILLRDLTTGTDVAKWSITATVTDYTTQPQFVKLTGASLSLENGIYAVAEIDWSQAVTGTYNYTTVAQSGIHADQVRSDELISDYLQRDVWHEVIRVGSGQTYTTLRAAVESLYDSPAVQTCARACYDHQILIDLMDAGAYTASFLGFPEFVGLRGQGVDRTFIDKESDATDALLEMHYETKMAGLTVRSMTGDGGAWLGEYCVHSDDFNRVSRASRNRRIRQSFKSLKFIGGPNNKVGLFACGASSGQHVVLEDVHSSHMNMATTAPGFASHNTGITPSYLPTTIEMISCRSTNTLGPGVLIMSLGGGNKCRLLLQGGDLGLVAQGVTGGTPDLAADRYEWEITGSYDGPVVQADAGMIVLQTTAGQTPSGTAAALIFGTTDELGRGDKCVLDATIRSLGARLGDCAAVPKALTIGAQTHNFTTDLTAVNNATIIAAINASLTTHPVSEKNVQYETYPDIGHSRRMLNSTGATIAAGRFVKRTGVNTIALASGSDDVFGLVVRDILNGLAGVVVTARQIHGAYISGASSDGLFGITTGVLDFGAATKKGVVAGGIARIY